MTPEHTVGWQPKTGDLVKFNNVRALGFPARVACKGSTGWTKTRQDMSFVLMIVYELELEDKIDAAFAEEDPSDPVGVRCDQPYWGCMNESGKIIAVPQNFLEPA